MIPCRQCFFWRRIENWEFEGFSGPVGRCLNKQVVRNAYDDRASEYREDAVYLHDEGGETGSLHTAPEFACMHGCEL